MTSTGHGAAARGATPRRLLALLAPIAVALGACTDANSADPTPTDPSLALVAVATPKEYVWSNGQGGVMMGSITSQVCFLTHVAGSLDNPDDWVAVYAYLGKWFLGGNTYKRWSYDPNRPLAARARCIATSAYTDEIWVNSGSSQNATKTFPLGSGYACGLTMVGGAFESLTDAVLVLPRQLVAHGQYTRARARCAQGTVHPVGPEWQWKYSQYVAASTAMVPTSQASICVLTGVAGEFDGPTDRVHIKETNGSYHLSGSMHDGLAAWGGCMRK
jgi:hypothetical protein